MDYEALEGKIIDYFNGEETLKAIVAGCNPDIGITVVAANNKDNYLCCILGPLAPQWREHFGRDGARKVFDSIVECIMEGYLSGGRIKAKAGIMTPSDTKVTQSDCPFGQ